jgi:cytochrome b
MQTRELIAQAVTGLNGPAGATMVLAAMKLVSVPMGTGALAGFAELLIGLAVILHVCVIEPLTLVRGVPVPAED